MKKRLINLLGIVLCLPIPFPIIAIITNNSGWIRWIFEKNLFPVLDWANNSCMRVILICMIWFVAAASFVLYAKAISKCFLYTPKLSDAKKEEYEQKRISGWLNA